MTGEASPCASAWERRAAMAAKHGAYVAALRWIKGTKGSVMKKRISEFTNRSERHVRKDGHSIQLAAPGPNDDEGYAASD
jgi:hypothetical protein